MELTPVINIFNKTQNLLDFSEIRDNITNKRDTDILSQISRKLKQNNIQFDKFLISGTDLYQLNNNLSELDTQKIIIDMDKIYYYNSEPFQIKFDNILLATEKFINKFAAITINNKINYYFKKYFDLKNNQIKLNYSLDNSVINITTADKYFLNINGEYISCNSLSELLSAWPNKNIIILDQNNIPVVQANISKYKYSDKLKYELLANPDNIIPIFGTITREDELITHQFLINKSQFIHNNYIPKYQLKYPLEPFANIPLEILTINITCIFLSAIRLSFSISPQKSVLDLKNQIQKLENIPVDQQRIVCGGKQLEDNYTLEYYKIKNNSNIHVILRLRGGGASIFFADMDSTNLLTGKLSDTVPDYRIINNGLNLDGPCKNPSCRAYSHPVISQAGFGIYNIANPETYPNCPVCKTQFSPETCGFFRCSWRFCGIKSDNKIIKNKWSSISEQYKYFDESKKTFWNNLLVITRPLDYTENNICIFCAEPILENQTELACEHKFHDICLSDWQKNNNTCPLCLKF